MKRTHISLPSLQVAATAFLATTCQAEHHYCVDQSTSEVVAAENCEGDVETFTTVKGRSDAAVGDVLARREDTDDKLSDDLGVVAEFVQRFKMMGPVAGGFGCDCSDSGGRGGTGGAAGAAAGRGRGS